MGYALTVSTPSEQRSMSAADDYRLCRIESVIDAAVAHLDVEDLLVELLDRVRELLQVDTATVLSCSTPRRSSLLLPPPVGLKRRSAREFASPWGRVSPVASQRRRNR